ncbi:MAG: T9SS type A sorting domain-containing protein [Bacteroidia bacterium]
MNSLYRPFIFMAGILIFLLPISLKGQEEVRPLEYQEILYWKYANSGPKPVLKQSTDTIELPFFDDFSNYPHYHFDSLWMDDYVLFNDHLAVEPPSLGVATFDGYDGRGIIYSGGNTAAGALDTLTSAPINLSGRGGGDDIWFSFFYQPGGIGDPPDGSASNTFTLDSLKVEFKPDSFLAGGVYNSTDWIQVFAAAGPGRTEEFQQVFIELTDLADTNWFHNAFQFRFISYGSRVNHNGRRSGSYDIWHVDYVELNENRTENEPAQDLSSVYPVHSILKTYYSMPWKQFASNPDAELIDSLPMEVSNLADVARTFNRGYSLTDHQTGTVLLDRLSILADTINPGNVKRVHVNPFTFANPPAGDLVEVMVKSHAQTVPDFVMRNDTAFRLQRFYNYLAYDDGTPEAGYGLANSSGKIALRFRLNEPETLRGISIHFNKADTTLANRFIDLVVYEHISPVNQPANSDVELYRQENVNIRYTGWRNGFHLYVLNEPVPVNGTFYVGLNHGEEFFINIGMDLNYQRFFRDRTINSNLFFNVLDTWKPSVTYGAPMIRPVFGDSALVDVTTPTEPGYEVEVYPNPATDRLHVRIAAGGKYRLELLDVQGRVLQSEVSPGFSSFSVSSYPEGLYLIKATSQATGAVSVRKVIFR